MYKLISILYRLYCRVPILIGVFAFCFLLSESAYAETSLIDSSLNLAPFVPLVLSTMVNIAGSVYNYFVGNGTGIIYLLIYFFAGFYIALYAVKMFLPKEWLGFFGFSPSDSIWDGKLTGWSVAENVLKPCLRAIIACVILLQVRPIYITKYLVNPFLEFGAFYTNGILKTIRGTDFGFDTNYVGTECTSIEQSGWLSKSSCEFMVMPVYTISKENNTVIKYGFGFLNRGLRGLSTLIPHGGKDFLNVLTGLLLVSSFTSANFFMALLIIQGIFDFCLALIMYPFKVLSWVAKKSDSWFDIFPAFSQIIDALKKLVITMVACAFILCINIALVRALFNWSSATFNAATGGMAVSNVPSNTATSFGQHSMLWISSVLTFFLMLSIFNMTREQLQKYSGAKPDLYNEAAALGKYSYNKAKATPEFIKKIIELRTKLKKS